MAGTDIAQIGKMAGELWDYLGKNGPTAVDKLPDLRKQRSHLTHQALGWLAREDKIQLSGESRTSCLVSLTEMELHHYHYQQKAKK